MIYLRKLLLFSCLSISVFIIMSCTHQEKKQCEIFQENYLAAHPNGYDMNYKWYKYKDESIEEDNEGKKTIRTIDFVGYINFNKDSIKGITTKFMYNIEVISVQKGKVVKYIKNSTYLNNSHYYEINETSDVDITNKIIVSKGCSNAKYFNVEFFFNNELFFVNLYHSNKALGYDFINVTKDCVTFDRAFANNNYSYSEKSGFYYDEQYSINKMFLYANKTYNGTLNQLQKNVSITRFLMLCDEVEITVPLVYDEEYIYNTESALIGW